MRALGAAAIMIGCIGSIATGSDSREPLAAQPPQADETIVFAAPGRIEGGSDVVEVGTAMDGVIEKVLVAEGDPAAAGQVLVRLVCDDLEARLAAARADAESLRQVRRRLLRGSRKEERDAAAAATAAARAALTEASLRYERLRELAEKERVIAPQDRDQGRRDRDVAQANLQRAVEQERVVNAEPLPEETARADADIAAAESRAREAEARVAKCSITSPIDATVLRVHLREGEQVSLALPRALISLADTSRWRVRAEVDERDVGRIGPGWKVRVECDALDGSPLIGHVTRVEPLMGRKRIRTGDPAEKSDRDVQEVIVDLDATDVALVIGLRVTAHFLSASVPP